MQAGSAVGRYGHGLALALASAAREALLAAAGRPARRGSMPACGPVCPRAATWLRLQAGKPALRTRPSATLANGGGPKLMFFFPPPNYLYFSSINFDYSITLFHAANSSVVYESMYIFRAIFLYGIEKIYNLSYIIVVCMTRGSPYSH